MDTDKLNKWLALGANFGVLIGIVFLAVEIRQNTEMTRAQITQNRAEMAVSIAHEIVSSDYIPRIALKSQRGEELSDEEFLRYDAWVRAVLRNQENNYLQYKQGLLGDHIPRHVTRLVSDFIISGPHGRAYWERDKLTYSDEFIEFVDSVIAEADSSK